MRGGGSRLDAGRQGRDPDRDPRDPCDARVCTQLKEQRTPTPCHLSTSSWVHRHPSARTHYYDAGAPPIRPATQR